MMMTRTGVMTLACVAGFAVAADPSPNLTVNPGFLDTDTDMVTGDGWGVFGAALADLDFFGDGNPGHATIFADVLGNAGGVFQAGIAASEGVEYEATFKIQFEQLWDADASYGIEFYAADDATKLGEQIIAITDTFAGFGYRRYDVSAVAPVGSAFVRPVVLFDNVRSAGSSRAATIDNVLVREADDVLNLNPGFGDLVGDGNNGDQWGVFGAAALDLDFFNNGNPGHATLFADQPGNSGGVFQQGVAGTPGESYTFSVDIAFEDNYDAETFIAIEFYASDDGFIAGPPAEVEIMEAPGAGYVTYTVEGVAPAPFTAFVRPIVRFENAVGTGAQKAATVDNAVIQFTSTVSQGCNPADLAEPFGDLTFGDISAFLGAFNTMDPAADLASPFGQFTFGDISVFLGAFDTGCP
jgi:hypothetical protein